jgi:hypothetical protein
MLCPAVNKQESRLEALGWASILRAEANAESDLLLIGLNPPLKTRVIV